MDLDEVREEILADSFYYIELGVLDPTHPVVQTLTALYDSIMYLDAYKYINFQMKIGNILPAEKEMLYYLNNCIDMQDVHDVLEMPAIYELANYAVEDFYEAPLERRILEVKAIDEETRLFLLEKMPIFEEDLNKYDNVSLKDLYVIFETQKQFYQSINIPYQKGEVLQEISCFLKQLFVFDQNNYLNIVNQLINLDKIVSKRLIKTNETNQIAHGLRKSKIRLNNYESGKIISTMDDYFLEEVLDIFDYEVTNCQTFDNFVKKYKN